MAYYFQKIDTRLTPEQLKTEQITLYNLDEFHTIRQSGMNIIANRDGEKNTYYIARCKTVEAVRYIIENILNKQTITRDDVMAVEEGNTP
jgi:hypothetical protein